MIRHGCFLAYRYMHKRWKSSVQLCHFKHKNVNQTCWHLYTYGFIYTVELSICLNISLLWCKEFCECTCSPDYMWGLAFYTHDHINSLSAKLWDHKADLSPPHHITGPVSIEESDLFCHWILKLFLILLW
jgi:hypothetical protein